MKLSHVEVDDTDPSCVVVRVRGEVDMSNGAELRSALRTALALTMGTVVRVDLGAVSFFGSEGIGALVAAREQAAPNGRRLVVDPRSAIVERVLDVVGLSELFSPAGSGGPAHSKHIDGRAGAASG